MKILQRLIKIFHGKGYGSFGTPQWSRHCAYVVNVNNNIAVESNSITYLK